MAMAFILSSTCLSEFFWNHTVFELITPEVDQVVDVQILSTSSMPVPLHSIKVDLQLNMKNK